MIAENMNHSDLVLLPFIDVEIDIKDRLIFIEGRFKLHIGVDIALLPVEIFDRLRRVAHFVREKKVALMDEGTFQDLVGR